MPPRVILSGVRPRSHLALLGAASQFDFATAPRFCFAQDDTFGLCPNAGGRSRTRRAMRSIGIYEGKRRTPKMVTEISYPQDTIMGMVGVGYQEAPSGRARRVKKICLWHIFSQSGKQAMLATWAEGWRRRRLRESALQYSKCQSKVARAPSTAIAVPLPPGGRLLLAVLGG